MCQLFVIMIKLKKMYLIYTHGYKISYTLLVQYYVIYMHMHYSSKELTTYRQICLRRRLKLRPDHLDIQVPCFLL